MTDLERLVEEATGMRFHQTLDITDASFLNSLPPSFQLVSGRTTFVLLPYIVDGNDVAVEVFGFDADGRERLHQHLTLI